MTTVYLSNLPFTASERDLHAFLSDYGATSVLIPTQTVRRFSKKRTDKPRQAPWALRLPSSQTPPSP